MKNLMSRDEYINAVNEGVIRDFAKKAVNKVKSLFTFALAKVKDFLGLVDSEGNLLPVTTSQASVDYIASGKVNGVQVLATKSLNDDIANAGGKGANSENFQFDETDDTPTGNAYVKWVENGEYRNTNEYKNYVTLFEALNERAEKNGVSLEDELNERVHYTGGVNGVSGTIGVERMKEVIRERIDVVQGTAEEGSQKQIGALLFFGAPGIGKSTVPKAIIKEYNKDLANDADKLALISVNCANIAAGDFFMPSMPEPRNFQQLITKTPDMFCGVDFEGMDDDKKDELMKNLRMSGNKVENAAPVCWLPVYKPTGDDELDYILNAAANGYLDVKKEMSYEDVKRADGTTKRIAKPTTKFSVTGGGGIILLDELLRADPGVFKQLMNFLLDGTFDGWYLGDKWTIIACSNRPCDDKQIQKIYKEMGSAERNRFTGVYNLIPDKDQWIAWAKKAGFEDIIFDFIFDEDGIQKGDKNEFRRWHNIGGTETQGDDEKDFVEITPRSWEAANINFINAKLRNKVNTIARLDTKEIKKCMEVFPEWFQAEFIEWFNKHRNAKIDFREILKNGDKVIPPTVEECEPTRVLSTLIEGIKKEYTKTKEKLSDDDWSTILRWVGKNYEDPTYGVHYFVDEMVQIYKDDDAFITDNPKTMTWALAAYPMPYGLYQFAKYQDKTPKAFYDEIYGIIKENFPWHDDGERIRFLHVADEDDDSGLKLVDVLKEFGYPAGYEPA